MTPKLPPRSCIATWLGDGKGLHFSLGVKTGSSLIELEPGAQLDLYTAAKAVALAVIAGARVPRVEPGA